MEYQKYYLKEFQYLDGATEIIMNIVDINFDKMTIHIAETNQGKITVKEYDLKRDNKFNLYFEYGLFRNKIDINDFEDLENYNGNY
jgi:hypothetical protein